MRSHKTYTMMIFSILLVAVILAGALIVASKKPQGELKPVRVRANKRK